MGVSPPSPAVVSVLSFITAVIEVVPTLFKRKIIFPNDSSCQLVADRKSAVVSVFPLTVFDDVPAADCLI